MKTSFTWGGLLSLVLLSMSPVHAQSEFHALDKLSRQDTGVTSSRLDDSELDRVEGGLEIVSVSTRPVDLTSQVVMQTTLLESTAQTTNDRATESRIDRTTSLIQVCGPQSCSQNLSQTARSGP
jgi:hypothetical protein